MTMTTYEDTVCVAELAYDAANADPSTVFRDTASLYLEEAARTGKYDIAWQQAVARLMFITDSDYITVASKLAKFWKEPDLSSIADMTYRYKTLEDRDVDVEGHQPLDVAIFEARLRHDLSEEEARETVLRYWDDEDSLYTGWIA